MATSPGEITKPGKGLFYGLLAGGLLFMAAAFFMQRPDSLLPGWARVVVSPGLLLTDFMAVGGVGAAFFNAGMMMVLAVLLCRALEVPSSGGVAAAVLSVGGFAFFGKTPLNALPLIAGVFLFARFKQMPLKEAAQTALFATAMGPMCSHAMLGMGLPAYAGVPLGLLLGLLAGFLTLPVAEGVRTLHRGHNLYNVGVAAGLITTLLVNAQRLFGLTVSGNSLVSPGGGLGVGLFLVGVCAALVLVGWLRCGRNLLAYRRLLKAPGIPPNDFVKAYGAGAVLMNIGLLALVCLLFLLVMGAPVNGPTVGVIVMAVGFGASGLHLRNALPVMLGALAASALGVYPLDGTGTLVVLVFSTTLGPVSGVFGPLAGAAAGALHVAVAHQLAGLQGGANLYNNGFAGGLVAAVLAPVLAALSLRRRQPPGA